MNSPHLLPRERAAVLWGEHVARNTARSRDDVFGEVRRHFSDAELVELTGVCGQFAMSNRIHNSLRLPIEDQHDVSKIKRSVRADPNRIKSYLEQIIEFWPQEFPLPPAGAAAPPRTAATQCRAAAPHQPAPRVPLLDPHTAPAASAQFMRAAQSLLGGLPNAVRILAHIPHIAKLALMFYWVQEREGPGGILPAALRALVLLRTSHVNTASYGIAHYTELALNAGLTADQVAATGSASWADSGLFTPRECAAMLWAEQIALNTAERREDGFAAVRQHFDNTEIMELTGLSSICNTMNMIQNALRVPVESAAELVVLNRSVRLDPRRLKTYLETVLADWPAELPVPDAAVAA